MCDWKLIGTERPHVTYDSSNTTVVKFFIIFSLFERFYFEIKKSADLSENQNDLKMVTQL